MCKNCGHNWTWHYDYDNDLDRFTEHDCEHWEGCDCKHYIEVDNA